MFRSANKCVGLVLFLMCYIAICLKAME